MNQVLPSSEPVFQPIALPSRPRGGSDAKDRILSAAQTSFLRHGYSATTMRAVAAAADVDPALISYHFGSKQGLFGGVMALGISPGQVMDRALKGDPQQMPQQTIRAILATWDDPETGGSLTLLVTQAQRGGSLRACRLSGLSRRIHDLYLPDRRRRHGRAAASEGALSGMRRLPDPDGPGQYTAARRIPREEPHDTCRSRTRVRAAADRHPAGGELPVPSLAAVVGAPAGRRRR